MAESRRAIYASIAGDAGVAATKFAAAFLTGSSGMLSEGIHSVVDAANGALLLVGLNQSERPPDRTHPFGHGQELYFWTLIVAVVIFGVGGGFSTYEGVIHLVRPHPVRPSFWNYVVLGAAFLLQGSASLVALRDFRKVVGEEGVLESAIESKDPTIFAVVFEDAAAMAGLVIAFLGLLLDGWLRSPVPDALASLVIGLLLAAVAVFLVHETRSLLAGESADPDMVQAIGPIAGSAKTASYNKIFLLALRRALELDPAFDDITEALKLAPDSVPALLERGNIRSVRGDPEGARLDWERVAIASPGTAAAAAARKNLERLAKGG